MSIVKLGHHNVVLGKERGHVRVITLNRPRQLNALSSKLVELLTGYLEKWEKDDDAELVIFKGAGRAFSAGDDIEMIYEGKLVKDSCLEVVYRMYWLCYRIHTYKKPMVALAHGDVIGGGGAMVVPMKFSIVTEKMMFSMPEASIGYHTGYSFSYIISRLPGHLGEYMALTGARITGKDMIAAGLATHFILFEKLQELEQRLLSLNSGDETAIRAVIEEFSLSVQPDGGSILHKLPTIDKCFSKESVEDIITSLEAEASTEGNEWILQVLKRLKRSSPTGLKTTLRSIREGRKQTLSECLKKEFRLTINSLRSTISGDVYEGIRAICIDKDESPKWEPSTLGEVTDKKIDLSFQPFSADLELKLPVEVEICRSCGKTRGNSETATDTKIVISCQ